MWTSYGPIKTPVLPSPPRSPPQEMLPGTVSHNWSVAKLASPPASAPTFWTGDLQLHGDSLTAYQLSGFHRPINFSVKFLSMA